ncbi:MAG TPA: class I SAM-dependent methyltransferase [Bacteroidales bacterium]|jgi:SAM-dependent methyltransferase|nr:class I SAM-dependent methyltransferase [Bacteroidales bacterium]HQJ81635.1 class I SAM-dependent methyltransferase [Bacteroidales bacterium]
MQYEPIKRSVGRFFSGSLFMRKTLYFLLDILLLRTWHIRKALREARGILPDDARILDAGSGFGQYVWRLSRMGRNWKITGVDIDREMIEDCRDFFGRAGLSERVSFREADLTTFSDPVKYDLILSVDVMEHIEDDGSVFRNFRQSLSEGGILIISTPSDTGGSGVHSPDEESFIGEHVRNGYGTDEIRGKLTAAGFSSINIKYSYGVPGNISWHISMKYPVRLLNKSMAFALVLPFYYLIAFPAALILNFLDLRLSHEKGSGLVIKAVK